MKELADFEPTEEQFGIFWKYIQDENVTDVDYNGREIWITDLVRGHYKAEEKPDEKFLVQFTHMVANCVNRQFNRANKILEADTRELRISILHKSVSIGGTSICIRKSPPESSALSSARPSRGNRSHSAPFPCCKSTIGRYTETSCHPVVPLSGSEYRHSHTGRSGSPFGLHH